MMKTNRYATINYKKFNLIAKIQREMSSLKKPYLYFLDAQINLSSIIKGNSDSIPILISFFYLPFFIKFHAQLMDDISNKAE